MPDRLGDPGLASFPLDAHRVNEDVHPGRAPLEDVEHIPQRGAGGGRDDGDSPWEFGDRLFQVLIEKPFLGQFLFQSLELRLERARAFRLDESANQLVCPGVDRLMLTGCITNPILRTRKRYCLNCIVR